jgi:hypothetical protein
MTAACASLPNFYHVKKRPKRCHRSGRDASWEAAYTPAFRTLSNTFLTTPRIFRDGPEIGPSARIYCKIARARRRSGRGFDRGARSIQ